MLIHPEPTRRQQTQEGHRTLHLHRRATSTRPRYCRTHSTPDEDRRTRSDKEASAGKDRGSRDDVHQGYRGVGLDIDLLGWAPASSCSLREPGNTGSALDGGEI
jgi:hypothetical protein